MFTTLQDRIKTVSDRHRSLCSVRKRKGSASKFPTPLGSWQHNGGGQVSEQGQQEEGDPGQEKWHLVESILFCLAVKI